MNRPDSASEGNQRIGVVQGHVHIVPYSPDWPHYFEVEQRAIAESLGIPPSDVQHVGSTAVPGIDAKPIIDMVIGVADPKGAEPTIRAALEALGWELRHEAVLTGNRLFFVKGDPRTHHLHIVERHTEVWSDMLLFREFLHDHPEVAAQYSALKAKLAARFATQRESYTRGKGPFIQAAIATARGEKSLEEFLSELPELTS